MKKILPLIASLFMFLLTTLVWVLLSISVKHSFDFQQKLMLGMIILAGYLTSGLYAYTYYDNKRRSNQPIRF